MTELARARQLKRDRDARCKALKASNGAVLGFRVEQIGLIGDLLLARSRLSEWDTENAPAIAAAIAEIVRESLGIPSKATRRLNENPDVPSFEPTDSDHHDPIGKTGCSPP